MTKKFMHASRTRFPILWLTGNMGAGKSTLAFGARDHFNESSDQSSLLARRVVVLDGDLLRESISTEEGFSAEDRRKHNLRTARLAAMLQREGFLVIVAVIAPFESVRKEIDALCTPQWIFVKRLGLDAPDRPYELPVHPSLVIDCDVLSIDDARMKFVAYMHGVEMRARRDAQRAASESGQTLLKDKVRKLVKNRRG